VERAQVVEVVLARQAAALELVHARERQVRFRRSQRGAVGQTKSVRKTPVRGSG
jgi:hypothetical protein